MTRVKLMGKRKKSQVRKSYLVKWKYYPFTECTWEDTENLSNVRALTTAFNRHAVPAPKSTKHESFRAKDDIDWLRYLRCMEEQQQRICKGELDFLHPAVFEDVGVRTADNIALWPGSTRQVAVDAHSRPERAFKGVNRWADNCCHLLQGFLEPLYNSLKFVNLPPAVPDRERGESTFLCLLHEWLQDRENAHLRYLPRREQPWARVWKESAQHYRPKYNIPKYGDMGDAKVWWRLLFDECARTSSTFLTGAPTVTVTTHCEGECEDQIRSSDPRRQDIFGIVIDDGLDNSRTIISPLEERERLQKSWARMRAPHNKYPQHLPTVVEDDDGSRPEVRAHPCSATRTVEVTYEFAPRCVFMVELTEPPQGYAGNH